MHISSVKMALVLRCYLETPTDRKCPSACLSIHPPVCLSVCLSVHLSVLLICLSSCLSLCLTVHFLFICPSVFLSIHLSICLSLHPSNLIHCSLLLQDIYTNHCMVLIVSLLHHYYHLIVQLLQAFHCSP